MDKASPGYRSTLAPALFLAAIFFQNFISRIIIAPLLPAIETDLGLSHGQAGSFFFLITAGFVVTMLGSGFFSSRFGHRRTILLCVASVGFALLLVASSSSLWTIRAALVLLGMSTGMYLPSGIATLTQLIDPKDWGKGLAIHELGPNLAFVAAPLVAEICLRWFSWQGVLAMVGGVSLVLAAMFSLFGRGGDLPGQAPSLASFGALVRNPLFWVMIALFGLGVSGTVGIYAMLPLYLVVERGIDAEWANTLVALSRVSGIGTAFVAGFVTDRLGPKRTLFGIFLLSGTLTILLGVSHGPFLNLPVLLQPALATCFFPPGIAALSSLGLPVSSSVRISLTIPLAFLLGGGVVPTFIGMMGDAGLFSPGMIVIGVLLLGGSLLALTLSGRRAG